MQLLFFNRKCTKKWNNFCVQWWNRLKGDNSKTYITSYKEIPTINAMVQGSYDATIRVGQATPLLTSVYVHVSNSNAEYYLEVKGYIN